MFSPENMNFVTQINNINTKLTNLTTSVNNITPVSLYSNASGSNGTITLSQTAANFHLIDIIYAKGDIYQSTRVWEPNGKTVSLIMGYKMSDTDVQIQTPTIKIDAKKITKVANGGTNLGNGGVVNNFTGNEVKIYKVIGYKISI